MVPVLSNNPYLFVALELDAEWSRWSSTKGLGSNHPLNAIRERVSATCDEYRFGIEQVADSYAKVTETPVSKLGAHLYKPIFFLPDGHSDCLALILVDDYDAILHIAAHCTTIESLSMGFCPSLESLKLTGQSFLIEPHFLWAQVGLGALPPIATLTKLKLDGLCSLEYNLLFKRAVFRAIASKCAAAIAELQSCGCEGFYSESQLDTVKVSLLSLQGQEEVGVLILSENATINMALNSAVRTLTLHDFLADKTDPPVKSLTTLLTQSAEQIPLSRNGYRHGDLHRRLAFDTKLRENRSFHIPVFRWSKSILGFATEFKDDSILPSNEIAGYVAVDLDLHLAPGHNKIAENNDAILPDPIDVPSGWHLAQVGISDIRLSLHTKQRLIPSMAAVDIICDSIKRRVASRSTNAENEIVGISSSFLVPVPSKAPFKSEVVLQSSPLDQILPALSSAVEEGHSVAGIDLSALRKIPKSYGLPRPLRRTVESLIKRFLNAILNPNLFDLVADLLDAVVTFSHVLTTSLPKALVDEGGHKVNMEQLRTSTLAIYATALKNAIEERLDLVHPSPTVRNVSIQFPGNFAQILSSSDAPIKACLGILKYHVARAGSQGVKDASRLASLHELGVVTQVTLEPGIKTFDLVLGLQKPPEGAAPRLSFLQMDLDHLFHVGSYFDHAHEAFHLIFDELFLKSTKPETALVTRKLCFEDLYTRERVEELWVHIACFLFFAPERPRSLLFHLIGKYALDVRSGGPDWHLNIRNFSEQVARLVTVTALIEEFAANDWEDKGVPSLERICETFRKCASTIVRLFPECGGFSEEKRKIVECVLADHIQVFWREANLEQYLEPLWNVAIEDFYLPLRSQLGYIAAAERAGLSEELKWLERGWSITRHGQDGSSQLEAVAATGVLLGNYLTRLGEMEQEGFLHLERDREGNVVFGKSPQQSAPYLIDRGASQRFCFDASSREKRLVHQIAILESFGDISSHFRARRVLAVIGSDEFLKV